MPFYEYDEARFFRPDGAPDAVAERRRAGFMRLAEIYQKRYAETREADPRGGVGISDLQFTAAYRVPFQYSRFVRQNLSSRRLRQHRRPAFR